MLHDDSFELPSASIWTPSAITSAWLASLPPPPGCSTPPTPASRQEWELVERYRSLLEALELVEGWEKQKLDKEEREWEERAEALEPIVKRLNLAPSAALGELAEIHALLPLALPPRGALAHDTIPSLFAAVQDLDERTKALALESLEAQNLQLSLEEEAEQRKSYPTSLYPAPTPEQDAMALKLLKSASLLDRKADEYRSRLTESKKRIPPDLDMIPSLADLEAKTAEYSRLKARRTELKAKLAAFGDLPSDIASARAQVDAKKQELKGLRRVRDKMMSEIGAGVA